MGGHSITVEIDEGILRAIGRTARDHGHPEDVVVEEALRGYFGLRGIALLDDIAAAQAVAGVSLDDDEAMTLAVAELRAARADRPRGPSA